MHKVVAVIAGEKIELVVSVGEDGWKNVVVSRLVKVGTRRVRTRKGGWATMPAEKTRFHLAHNGDRFADNSDAKALGKKLGAESLATIERILGL